MGFLEKLAGSPVPCGWQDSVKVMLVVHGPQGSLVGLWRQTAAEETPLWTKDNLPHRSMVRPWGRCPERLWGLRPRRSSGLSWRPGTSKSRGGEWQLPCPHKLPLFDKPPSWRLPKLQPANRGLPEEERVGRRSPLECRCSPAACAWGRGASEAACGVKRRQETVSLQGRRLHGAQPQHAAALLEGIAGENVAQAEDQPQLRHLLKIRQQARKRKGTECSPPTSEPPPAQPWPGLWLCWGERRPGYGYLQKGPCVPALPHEDAEGAERAAVPPHPPADGFCQAEENRGAPGESHHELIPPNPGFHLLEHTERWCP